MLGAIASLVGGLVLLVGASDRLVVSAARISKVIGVSTIVIGALVVGLGTSAPELLVSALAAADGEPAVAMANVVGSNVANVTLVLGAAAFFAPLAARQRTLLREGPLMFVSVLVLAVVLVDGQVERFEAGFLLFGMLVAIYLLLRWSLTDTDVVDDEVDEILAQATRPIWFEIGAGLVMLGLTLVGANLVLDGALELGDRWGLSDTFLGVILGVGTSLPELATALAAARRAETDLVIGNVLGSNLFNSLAVAGTAGVVAPGVLAEISVPAVVFMVVTALVAGVFGRTGGKVVRLEGGTLLAGFVAFVVVSF